MERITPLVFDSLIFLSGMVLLEFIIFLIFATKQKINIGRILLAVLVANVASAIFGIFIPTGESTFAHFVWFGVAVLLAIIAEWLIYFAIFLNNPITNTRLMFISITGNIISYIAYGILVYKTLVESYL